MREKPAPTLDTEKTEEKELLTPERIAFYDKPGTLLLKLNQGLFANESLSNYSQKNGYRAKDESHITIIGFRSGEKIKDALAVLPESERSTLVEKIRSLIDQTDWRFEIVQEILHLTKEYAAEDTDSGKPQKKESIIQRVDVPILEKFYAELNQLLGTSIKPPPAHVTLYTKGDEEEVFKGIGINSQAELDALEQEKLEL